MSVEIPNYDSNNTMFILGSASLKVQSLFLSAKFVSCGDL